MSLESFATLLRTRWITIAVATLATLLGTLAVTLTTTPLYQASTRLFLSTTSGTSLNDLYNGSRFSQDRVLSYSLLITGETLAQRTIEKLNLDMSASQLQSRVTATVKPDTVLIDVGVVDPSPVRARDIANALSNEFVLMVRELETPRPGAEPDARVVVEQRASIPTDPVTPKPVRNTALGLMVGLALGIGLALLRDQLDNTVKERATLEEVTGVGLVGSIPVDKGFRSSPTIAFENNNSPVAEAFRKLRTNLQFLSVDNPVRVILVTSALPNEGKSTTAINLALALAESEFNVVLVDGDLRRPSVANRLDLVGSVGFSTVLSRGTSLSDGLQQTKYPNLTVLAAGVTPPNPSELIGSLAAKKLISELSAEFDYVIVDSSPLLAVTDGAVLGTQCDGVLVTARFGSTKRDQLMHAVNSLTSVGAVPVGAVITMTPDKRTAYSYNYYSHGYYGEKSTTRSTDQTTRSTDQTTRSTDQTS